LGHSTLVLLFVDH